MKNSKILFLIALLICLVCLSVACGSGEDTTVNNDVSQGEVTEPSSPDKHVHNFRENVQQATCSAVGRKAMVCACGEIEEGSEMIIPFTPHNANEATCTEDSVCADCGKVLGRKLDHFMVDSVVTVATCTTDGLAKSTCHRCGFYVDTVIPKQHELDNGKLIAANGNVGSACLKCGEISGYTEQTPLILLEFEDPAEIEKYPGFEFKYPATTDGAANPGKEIWMGYDVDKVKSLPLYMISFDFKLMADGHATKGESIFTYIGGITHNIEKPGTKQEWVWAFKYYESNGIVSTVMQGFTDSNSIKVEKGEWINFIGIVDNATRQLKVYINGTYIGARTIHDYSNPEFGGAFCMRLYDAVPVNGTSVPLFDNFKIVEIK